MAAGDMLKSDFDQNLVYIFSLFSSTSSVDFSLFFLFVEVGIAFSHIRVGVDGMPGINSMFNICFLEGKKK